MATAAVAYGPQKHIVLRHETAISASKFEIQFLEGMIDHHAMAVHMSKLPHEQAIHPEPRNLGDSIGVTQSAEITRMQGWLQQQCADTRASIVMSSMQPLEKMKGAAFEKEFLQMMIRHHAKAVKQARECQHRDKHSELHARCMQIERSQQQQIVAMKRWLCQCYRNCK